ncbi:protein-methionine-sulfoxide reductase catalytic subunit MsrP [Corallincola spongiicola]|uniref:Protein-methionine-sulfoxide reductase catalytic subunit MsrP n=1 Tax=Corallincola spongiicola TaxID=2520508 RepID=A0ABY1WNG5_9GAMM|nr:protein-methionine-sulfoxide reductase catalytic subunit MsrP [Corallincola spongiicola]TAA45102.1 protein-methionine-sulfoxide reductase catalytic subunit MsrP [Corallincola spongiicola]
MLIRSPKASELTEADITDEAVYQQRRKFIKQLAGAAGGVSIAAALPNSAHAAGWFGSDDDDVAAPRQTLKFKPQARAENMVITAEKKAISYNNFYEFGTSKDDPVNNAQKFRTSPWQVTIDGEAEITGRFDYEDILKKVSLQERIYRLRCVEAWSMVIPWIGFPLGELLKQFKPTSKARYVAFETLVDPEQMPGQRNAWQGGGIDYPYVEGLRIDEAMHPLTLMAVGMYGKTLPPQNGAPMRLVVPWKYGFKSIKSIVRISFTSYQPPTTWNILAPHEYGFYANVNPKVSHPRWSQASERLLTSGGLFDQQRVPTQLFNGYAGEVAALYNNMDLSKDY